MKRPKNKSLGPAFRGYLRQCEAVEKFYLSGEQKMEATADKIGHFMGFILTEMHKQMNTDHLEISGFLGDALPRWAEDAAVIREAFKFQGDFEDLFSLSREWIGGSEWEEKAELLVRPPFDNCMFMINDLPGYLTYHILEELGVNEIDMDSIVPRHIRWSHAALLIEQRTAFAEIIAESPEEWYAQRMKPGDKFWSVTMYLRAAGRKFDGILPFETHHNPHNPADWIPALAQMPPNIEINEDQWHLFANMQVSLYMIFLSAMQSQKRLHAVTRGRKAGVKIYPRKKKHREHIFYEHITVTIDPHFTPPEKTGMGLPFTPHRQHPVRGFVRHYKEPLKSGPNKGKTWTWISPHHRGDKELGVITHDYEVLPENTG